MGLTRVVGSIAVLPAALGWASHGVLPTPATFVLLHVAATGFLVALAATDSNANKTQKLLGKGEDGRMRLLGGLLFWPYHLGLRLRLQLRKLKSREPLYHEIIPGWYVGGWPEKANYLPPGNPSVIDCTNEFPKKHNSSRYLCLMVWDSHGPTPSQLREAVDWACLENEKGHPIYVHCAHGHGRSVAVIIACLLKKGICQTIDEAEAMIKSIRPKIRLNKRQRTHLQEWIKLHLKDKNTNKN